MERSKAAQDLGKRINSLISYLDSYGELESGISMDYLNYAFAKFEKANDRMDDLVAFLAARGENKLP